MRIVWDEPKRRATLETRGLDFATLTADFFETALITATRAGRFHAVGMHHGLPTTVIFLPLGTEAISIISMRTASTKERTQWRRSHP